MKTMKTKRIITGIALAANAIAMQAQGQVEMAVVIPAQQTYISENTAHVFRSKLLGAMTASGVASAEYSSIVVYPEISFTRKQRVEGGMHNIFVAEMQMNMVCEHIVTGTVFNSYTLTMNADGVNTDKAIMSGLSKLSNSDPRIVQFLSVSRQKVEDYYRDNTQALVARARNLATLKKFDEAIALLYAYPSSIAGYETVSKTIADIYKLYQRDECGQLVQQARSAYSVGSYTDAANWLSQVDMSSPCAAEAKALANRIKQSRDAEAARVLAAREKALQTAATVEKQRLKVVRDAAVAYYKHQPKYYFVY